MLDEPGRVRAILAALRGGIGALRCEWRRPLTLAAALAFAVVIAIALHGPLALPLFGRSVSLYPPGNLLTLAYALLFIRIAAAQPRRDRFRPRRRAAPDRLLAHSASGRPVHDPEAARAVPVARTASVAFAAFTRTCMLG